MHETAKHLPQMNFISSDGPGFQMISWKILLLIWRMLIKYDLIYGSIKEEIILTVFAFLVVKLFG